ncbi:Gfo/Idh/MocA family oxidoreductase [Candidatus Pelagibacter sp.]|nr:Gfo/Idh/MocA family oxidoreductase [Candidatus Pelagibacter sp.]
MNKIVIIGNGTHSKRIQKILKNKYKFIVFKPQNKSKINIKEQNLLMQNKIFFIASPNKTHYSYIKLLNNGKRYIYCEKPLTNNSNELKKLKKINKKKIYINFNYRFSEIANILLNKKFFNLKDLIYSNIIVSHNFAYKKNYKKNWRSSKKNCHLGIVEMLAIHWIDLMNYIFEIKKIINLNKMNISKQGEVPDTCNLQLITKNNAQIDIFNSYASSLKYSLLFFFKDRHIEINETEAKIFKSQLVKSSQNRTKKIKISKKIKFSKDFNGLKKSILFFLDKAKKNKNFSNLQNRKSLESNKYLFN